MDRDWFFDLLRDEVKSFSDDEAEARLENLRRDHPGLEEKEFIRRWVDFRLRQTGVVYGTPLASEEAITHAERTGFSQRWAVFLVILRIEADLAMEVGCTVSHCTLGNIRVSELLVCFSLLCRRFRLARKIHAIIPAVPEEGPAPRRLLCLARRVGRCLVQRAYIAGNPLIGLPIHNSFNYIDAKTLGRLAVAYFEHGQPDRQAIGRVLAYKDYERRMLLEALLALNLSERPLRPDSRRVMLAQIRASGLPWKGRRALRKMLREPASAMAVASAVRNDRFGAFLLEQVILAAVLDGGLGEKESLFIGDLASWLGVAPKDLAEREAGVIDFYQRHRAYLDAFMVSTAVQSYRQRMLSRLQRSIMENLGVIVQEIKGTGELAELVYRAGRGEKLNAEERARMRLQLLDILRTIPSLAIFSLPGGAVLLPLLLKYLPAALKPSGFAELDRKRARERMEKKPE